MKRKHRAFSPQWLIFLPGMLRSRDQCCLDTFFGLGLGLIVIGLGLDLGLVKFWSRSHVSWSRDL